MILLIFISEKIDKISQLMFQISWEEPHLYKQITLAILVKEDLVKPDSFELLIVFFFLL